MSDPRRAPIAMTREEAAQRRLASALRDIEDAQNKLANAAAALGSLHNVGRDTLKLDKLFHGVKALWYSLEEHARKDRDKILLDHDPTGYESQWGPLPTTTGDTHGCTDQCAKHGCSKQPTSSGTTSGGA